MRCNAWQVIMSAGLLAAFSTAAAGQVDTAWVRTYNGPGSGTDWATALAVDGQGNVYVTGGGFCPGTGSDYATIKYSPAGEELWVARYNGPGNGWDWADALAVDGQGNVYVTGSSVGSGTGHDYATIKYSPDGDELWVARYNGPGEEDDYAQALAVDGQGNVYVTGRSEGLGTGDDYATIKYSPDGDELWVARYNGPANSTDDALALAVDGQGYVYVTGWSFGDGTASDYATVKYSPTGEELWVARYNGPGNAGDAARALAVDGQGNVYVTGSSVGSGTGRDYATVKYSPTGEELWVTRYNGPGNSGDYANALAVDGRGNVYVTGYSTGSGTGDDYATIKYGPDGDELWVARYNGPGNDRDRANTLAVDGQGNVYVTGRSEGSGTGDDYATIKYSPDGDELWVARYNGPGNDVDRASALVVDAQGNAYVTGSSVGSGTGADYATVKYSPDGDEFWVARYNGPGEEDDYAHALAVDGHGNVYVTGSSGSGTGPDYATVKYGPDGDELWVARYNGPGNGDDWATALVVDGQGNVYVTGGSRGEGTREDYATIKYSPDGEELWVARYNGPGNRMDVAYALALDGQGNVYVTGGSRGEGTNQDYATVKYSPGGEELWVARYNGPGNDRDVATALAVDGQGNVYVTGSSVGSGTNQDYATIKYSPDGEELWVRRYSGPENAGARACALAVDGQGNVYVTGESRGEGTGLDYTTIKYSPDGDELWVVRYNGPGNGSDEAAALAVDGQGNVYVTGASVGSGTGRDYATIKYGPDGEELWVRRYNGPGNDEDLATALALDGQGNVYVTGPSQGSGTEWDYATIKYSPDGDELWVARYNGPANGWDEARALVVDGQGNVYVTGGSEVAGTGFDYATIKYVQSGGVAGDETPVYRPRITLGPNPLVGGIAILRFEGLGHVPRLPVRDRTQTGLTVNVYDVSGRNVLSRSLAATRSGTVSLDLRGVSAGIYLVRVESDGYEATRKLVVQK